MLSFITRFWLLRDRCGLAVVLLASLRSTSIEAQVLFDSTKAEMAGNADWVIDADLHNLNVGSGRGSGTTGGSDSNPQRIPTPSISGITASTAQSYWTGGISAWAVGLAKQGQTVIETLPYNGAITYGSNTNAQDLSHYKLFVVCEPNILFTAAEKTAILAFVKNGGSLFMVADHTASDRNNDGEDAVDIWNDFLTNNTVQTNPFGFTYNLDDVSPSETVDSATADPVTHGIAGTATSFNYSSGSTMNLTASSVAHAAVWQTNPGKVMALYGSYGAGRFVAIGDSSPCDDGSGDPGDTLYSGWNSGSNSVVILNASAWLLLPTAPAAALRILTVTRGSDGRMSLTFPSAIGKQYQIERSTDLTANAWTSLGGLITGDGTVKTVTDSAPTSANADFYRVKVVP